MLCKATLSLIQTLSHPSQKEMGQNKWSEKGNIGSWVLSPHPISPRLFVSKHKQLQDRTSQPVLWPLLHVFLKCTNNQFVYLVYLVSSIINLSHWKLKHPNSLSTCTYRTQTLSMMTLHFLYTTKTIITLHTTTPKINNILVPCSFFYHTWKYRCPHAHGSANKQSTKLIKKDITILLLPSVSEQVLVSVNRSICLPSVSEQILMSTPQALRQLTHQ